MMAENIAVLNITKENQKSDILKVIAIIFMIIDHIGAILFPTSMIFRILGRIAFPIFAFGITTGYLNTRNINKYMTRLLLFGMASQVPYSMFLSINLNIFFTLLAGLLCIHLIEKNKFTLLVLVLVATSIIPIDYGLYGVVSIITFYYFRDNKTLSSAAQVVICLFFSLFVLKTPLQLFSLMSLPLIYIKISARVSLNKFVFYSFYPAHILVLGFIKIFLHK